MDHIFSTQIQSDLLSYTNLKNYFKLEQPSHLLHLACTSTPRKSRNNLKKDIQDNLLGSIELFETYLSEVESGTIIYVSSGGDIYDIMDTKPKSEKDIPCPQSPYSIHKLSCEYALKYLCSQVGGKGIIFRVSNPYGVYLPIERGQGLIGTILSCLLHNKFFNLIDNPQTIRDYIHLDDLSRAFLISLNLDIKSGSCEVFNIGSGKGASIQEVFEKTEIITGKKIQIKYDANFHDKPMSSNILDTRKFKNLTGWDCQVDLNVGIQSLWSKISNQI
jgi:UDP-glucose 4-epimerase